MHEAFIGLGGNVGEVLQAFESVATAFGRSVVGRSRVYRTKAMMADASIPPGPDFWNAVLHLTTELTPVALLERLHALEAAAGRARRTRWEARPLDLDLLIYDDLRLDAPALTLPHPGLATRIFVLAPLRDVAPERTLPGTSATVTRALALLDGRDILEIRAWPT